MLRRSQSQGNQTSSSKQSAKEFLIEKGYDPQYGARPMRRAVERFLEDPLAEELLRGNVKAGDRVEVIAAEGKLFSRCQNHKRQSSAATPNDHVKTDFVITPADVHPRTLSSGVQR